MLDPTSQFAHYFSADYLAARRRFIDACSAHGFRHEAFPIDAAGPQGEPLSIDVGMLGDETSRSALVISSGLHGVEGPLGSAIQLAVMERLAGDRRPPAGAAVVMLHALNPFGYAWLRRFNEHNVDLNRNFLLPGEEYAGAPELAAAFHRVLGPRRAPSRLRTATARMLFLAMRHGVRSFWDTLPVGQYDLPDWLFYGGKELAQTGRLLQARLPKQLASAREVIHFDIHTGLGRWANCELLLSEREPAAEIEWWETKFSSSSVVESNDDARYRVRGGFGPWLNWLLPDCAYHFATAEFGTFSPARVIGAMSEECRANLNNDALPPTHWSRRRLSEAFAPRNPRWRNKSVATGITLAERATQVLWRC